MGTIMPIIIANSEKLLQNNLNTRREALVKHKVKTNMDKTEVIIVLKEKKQENIYL
jgi:hypothetical protein